MSAPPLPSTAEPPEGLGRPLVDRLPRAAGGFAVDPEALLGDYVERELFVSGEGDVYRYGATTDQVEVARRGVPYTTRILVHRPAPGAQFSGTLVLEIAHPEIGLGPIWPFTAPYLRANHDAHVIVTTRRNHQAYGESTPISALKDADPERYGPIDLEEGGLSWDVVAQTAALLRSESPDNPLADLDVRQLFLGGYSGAGAYTLMYLRSFHDRWRLADGRPLVDGYLVGEPSWYPRISTLDDRLPAEQGVTEVDVPVISLYTGSQLWMDHAVGPDTDRVRPDRDGEASDGRFVGYRTYELASGAHVNGPGCGLPGSDLRLDHAFRLTLHHLRRWADGTATPPRGNRVELQDTPPGSTPGAQRDEHGNVVGGVRTTFVDVPRARYSLCRESGSGVMDVFDAAKLTALYGDRESYAARVAARADELVAEGWLLPADAAEVVASAREADGF